jgi:hypothetical protein
MDPAVQAALIAAAVTVAGFLLRDLIFKRLESRREAKHSARRVYRSYSDPLTAAAVSLYWRLDEIVGGTRTSDYLVEANTDYERYKFLSTCYRLAAFIGWAHAFGWELHSLPAGRGRRMPRLSTALEGIGSALADGPHVERQRIDVLIELWSLDVPPGEIVLFGARVDTIFNRLVERRGVELPSELGHAHQVELVDGVADAAQQYRGDKQIPVELRMRTVDSFVARTSVREFWLYRDWQAGIGDFMIERSTISATRAYDVIGFAAFEARAACADPESVRWLTRIERLLRGLDIRGAPLADARISQFHRLHEAVASLLMVLVEISSDQRQQMGDAFGSASLTTAIAAARDGRVWT